MTTLAVIALHDDHAVVVRMFGHGLVRSIVADSTGEPDQHTGFWIRVGRDRVLVLVLNAIIVQRRWRRRGRRCWVLRLVLCVERFPLLIEHTGGDMVRTEGEK
jgi:hypothetical protein